MAKYITVDVTQEDIDLGQVKDENERNQNCPLARAVRRKLPTAKVGWSRLWPDGRTMSDGIPFSVKAANFVHNADRALDGELPATIVKPIRLRLRIA